MWGSWGDFNAWTAEEIEGHITPLDSHALFHRMGDTNPAHSPSSPLTNTTAPAVEFRGRLLLNMLNSTAIFYSQSSSELIFENFQRKRHLGFIKLKNSRKPAQLPFSIVD